LKEFDSYITLIAQLTLSPQHKAVLDQLKDEQKTQLFHKLLIEMSRAKALARITHPIQSISIFRRIPITSNLTEATFIEHIDEVSLAHTLANETIVLELEKPAKEDGGYVDKR
jgi:hypothetical protein